MTESRRRGACPGLSAPMQTGDGLLARLTPAAPVPLAAMAGLCAAARRHGNGAIEVTARGSLQARGLTPGSAPLFAAAVRELGIVAQESVPVVAGFDGGAADLVASKLRRAIPEARLPLSPKVSVVVDGDGVLHLDGLSADVRLRAMAPMRGLRFHLGVGGNGPGDVPATIWLGTVEAGDAVAAVMRVLSIVAARGPGARAADVVKSDGVAAFRAVPSVQPAAGPPPRTPAEVIGLHAMRDGTTALGVGLVFGQTHAAALAGLVSEAARSGVQTVRPAPDRTLLLAGISALSAGGLTTAAERLGFIIHADDPRRRIAACPGAPACASGLISARAIASTLAPAIGRLKPARGIAVHVSGCAKGCAHPLRAALTLVGTVQGCGVVHDGRADDVPRCHIDPSRLGDEIPVLAVTPESVHG